METFLQNLQVYRLSVKLEIKMIYPN
jgi:hypothetical protein